MNSEKGQALPMVLIAMVVGALVVSPFLSHVGTSLVGSKAYAQAIYSQYACDSGAEHAIWNLTNGGLTDNLSSSGDTLSYLLDESINSLTTSLTVSNSYETITSDNFESGGWAGGTGWLDDWYSEGDSSVTTSGSPYEGSYHLMLRSDTGYVKRSVDLSSQDNPRLRFWAKTSSFEGGEEAYCLVSANGTDWTTVHTWVDGDDDDQYHHHEIDLTPYGMSSQFWISFETNMSSDQDYLYIDYIEVKSGVVYGITSAAGDSNVKAVVELDGGNVTVWSWYII